MASGLSASCNSRPIAAVALYSRTGGCCISAVPDQKGAQMLFARQAFDTKGTLLLAAGVVLTSQGMTAAAQTAPESDRVGTVYEISRDVESAQTDSNKSTGSSTDRDTVVERVLEVRADGLELEYDFPSDSTAEDRASSWQFPLRVFKPLSGPPQLLNRPELEGRIEGWLKKGGLTRAACGHWVFTWNAFKIECDPQSALETVTAYDLRVSDLRDGGIYTDPLASAPTTLRRVPGETSGATFRGTMSVDPEHVRRGQAESDVVIAEITRKPLTLDDATRARSSDKISGTISISFEVDPSGFVRQRSKVTKLETTGSNGVVENRTVTEVVKRRIVSGEESPR